MIFFDLDGVFIPDMKVIESVDFDTLLNVRHNCPYPIFEPQGKWGLITGRPVQDASFTQTWINEFFINPPIIFCHDNTDMTKAAEYKAKTLLELQEHLNITAYVESDPNQVIKIRNLVNNRIKIFLFRNLITEIVNETSLKFR